MSRFQDDYNELLLEALKAHLPSNVNPTGFIMEVLNIERSAAYRRLRGEINFTFGEASQIARKLDLYLDQIVIKDRRSKVLPFRMSIVDFENPTETDYQILEEHISFVRMARQDPTSRLTVSANMLPQQIYVQFDNLLKYFFFKWAYYNVEKQRKAYHDILIPDRMVEVFKRSYAEQQEFSETCYIFDKFLFMYIVNDIQYFTSIGLVRNEDARIISRDLYDTLDYLEQVCISGKNKNGNDVQVYISGLNFDKSCYSYEIFNNRISMIEASVLNGIGTTDNSSFEMIQGWMLSRRSVSTSISLCGELQRTAFFNKQRQILSTL